MKTITLQIGNSDDKLTQKEWSIFVARINTEVRDEAYQVHFFAPSVGYNEWQNAAWIFSCEPTPLLRLKDIVTAIREKFNQDSAAWTEGETEFV